MAVSPSGNIFVGWIDLWDASGQFMSKSNNQGTKFSTPFRIEGPNQDFSFFLDLTVGKDANAYLIYFSGYKIYLFSTLAVQQFSLNSGWNWISLRVNPTSPQIESVFQNVGTKLEKVLAETAAYIPSIPAQFQNLKTIEPGKMYMVYLNQPSVLNVEGKIVPPTTPLSFHQGYNWVGFLPPVDMKLEDALSSVNGKYQRVINETEAYSSQLPAESTLTTLRQGQGYGVYFNQAVTLSYPPYSSQAPGGVSSTDCPAGRNSSFTNVYGYVNRAINLKANTTTRLQAVDSKGNIYGCSEPLVNNKAKIFRIYGQETLGNKTLPGFKENDKILIRVVDSKARIPYTYDPRITYKSDLDFHSIGVEPTPTAIPTPKPLPTKKIPTPTPFKKIKPVFIIPTVRPRYQ